MEQSAIIVSPDYRLLPESKGVDILEDLDDFWNWVQTDLPGVIAARSTGLEVDLERIVVTGDSAGKMCSVVCHFTSHVFQGVISRFNSV